MLVKLYALPALGPILAEQAEAGITIRPARSFEVSRVADFVRGTFTQGWADEISVGYARQPVSVLIATEAGQVKGFAAYDCTARGFFGPTGVEPSLRGRGVGTALLVATLHAMREAGYGYAIIGGVGPAEFYARTVGATLIPDSTPGIYTDMLAKPAPPAKS